MILVVAALCLAPSLCFGATASGKGGEVSWKGWDAGLRSAASMKRPVLVDVYTDWCGWCRRMDRDVYSRADVREYLSRRFVTVKLDAESSSPATYAEERTTERALATRFGVKGYPTTVFLRPNGERLVNVPGYVPPERFLLLLQYIGDGHLERGVSFEDFAGKAGTRTPTP
jgi:thioredoxin-related protein